MIQNVPLSFHSFENPTVLYAIQSSSRDQNVPLFIVQYHPITSLLDTERVAVLIFYCIMFPIRSLQEAVKHTERPIEVLGIFDSVLKLINETMKKANETRIAIDDLMSYVSIDSIQLQMMAFGNCC